MVVRELSVPAIKEAIKQLDNLKSDLLDNQKTIVERLTNMGIHEAAILNANAPRSGVEASTITGGVLQGGLKGYVALQGPNALYDEFGTGEEGTIDRHPLKDLHPNLKDYNSGPFVRSHINKSGRHYWFYAPMAGQPYFDARTGYTEGIPSGKQMYNTVKYLRKELPKITRGIKRFNKVVIGK